jgi:maleylacetoacetate isomerase/maleylpyruvate isomerase
VNNGGEQFKSQYLTLNPMAEVPTLVHGQKVIGQSMAIIEYLDEVFPKNPLFPKDPYATALVRQFCENINSFLHPLSNLKVLKKLENECQYDQQKKEAWIQHWSSRGLMALENLAAKSHGTYCFADHLTAADLFLAPALFSANRFHVDLANYPTLRQIDLHLNQLDCFIKAHPFNQPDSPAEVK